MTKEQFLQARKLMSKLNSLEDEKEGLAKIRRTQPPYVLPVWIYEGERGDTNMVMEVPGEFREVLLCLLEEHVERGIRRIEEEFANL